MSTEEKKQLARKLHDLHDYSYGQIAKHVGVPKTTVYRWLNEKSDSGTNREISQENA